LGLLHELAPDATIIALLVNPNNPVAESIVTDMQAAARTLGIKIHAMHASTAADLDMVFANLIQLKTGALMVAADTFFLSQREQLAAWAGRHAVPCVYSQPEFIAVGGLMSYGTDEVDSYRQVGIYTAKILKGEKPADLPVVQSTKFKLIINLKTAKALGLALPPGLLAIADEVVE
jgi:putative ABC transport system substrate-binding protein